MEPEDIENVVAAYISAVEWDMYQNSNASNEEISAIVRSTFETRMKDLQFLAIYTAQNAVPLARVPADIWSQSTGVKVMLANMLWAAKHAAHLTGRNIIGYIKLIKVLGRMVYCVLDGARPSLRNEPREKTVVFCLKTSLSKFDMAREIMGIKLRKFNQKHGKFINVNGENDFPHTDYYPLKS
jgi:hypothetical protein